MPKITYDSRLVEEGDIFVCLPKGDAFIEEARSRGAVDVIEMTRADMATFSADYYGRPSESLCVIGVTGTNGKTTVTFLVQQLLEKLGASVALSGTLTNPLTTPESLDLQRMMAEHLQNGGTHFVMEVSSHGIDQDRIAEIDFDVTCLTNISQDHLDYHESLEAYRACKMRFMQGYGNVAKLFPEDIEEIVVPKTLPLLGSFNRLNVQAAVGIVQALGYDADTIASLIPELKAPPGRFEPVDCGQGFTVIVDYAHTPDALENVLKTGRELLNGNARLIGVFGCGGDRDRGKRPLMGGIAGSLCDLVVVTSDNPRSEDPKQIIDDILEGMPEAAESLVIPDRQLAIETAIDRAHVGDVIIIAGKGHETYQILPTGRIDFDDREVARDYLKEMSH